ncbi:MAG TPA: O-antigen ligase family protein [Candidatus Baltobacteraceae bacterium]
MGTHRERFAPIALACLFAGLFLLALRQSLGSNAAAPLLAILIAALPALAIAAWRNPFVFPYGAYAIFVPLNLLLVVPAFGTVARLLGIFAGAAFLVWSLRARRIVTPSPALFGWGLFVALMGASLIWTMNPENGWRELGVLAQVFLLYAIVSIAPVRAPDLRLVFALIVAGGIAAALLGIHQFQHPSSAQLLLAQKTDRVPLFLADQTLDINEFAAAFLLPVALLAVTALRARNWLLKGLAGCGIAVMLAAMAFAASRGAFLALGVMLAYLIVAMPRERIQVFAMLGFTGALVAADPTLVHRFLSAAASGGSGRLSIWSVGFNAFKEHWIFGAGSGAFANAYDESFLRVYQAYDMGWSRAAHNLLLQNAVELGAIGAAVLLVALVLQVRILPKVADGDALFGMRTALMAATVALLAASVFIDLTTAKMLWLTFGLAAQVRGVILQKKAAKTINKPMV